VKPAIKPGDLLLYRNTWSPIGFLIRLKTWSDVNHVEVYIGDGHVVAARAGGCRIYPVTLDHLHYVWRPAADPPISLTNAMKWFMSEANGTPYDYWGLFRFFLRGKQSADKNFCSELAMRWLRAGGFNPFAPGTDADKVWPGGFIYSPKGDVVWQASQGKLHGEA